jgi:hypothetical protein
MIDIALMILVWSQGLMVGYIIWAPETNFKKGFIDGLTLKFLWNKK